MRKEHIRWTLAALVTIDLNELARTSDKNDRKVSLGVSLAGRRVRAASLERRKVIPNEIRHGATERVGFRRNVDVQRLAYACCEGALGCSIMGG